MVGSIFCNLIKVMASCRWEEAFQHLLHSINSEFAVYLREIFMTTTMTCGIRNKQLQIMY